MKISTRGRYSLRFMIDLAEHYNEGFIALKDIAARQNISIRIMSGGMETSLRAARSTITFISLQAR